MNKVEEKRVEKVRAELRDARKDLAKSAKALKSHRP